MLDEGDTEGVPSVLRGGDGGEDPGGSSADDKDIRMLGHMATILGARRGVKAAPLPGGGRN